MDVTITKSIKIYRVRYLDHYYQHSEPETNWHTSKEWCQSYIVKSSNKQCLSIETSELIIDE